MLKITTAAQILRTINSLSGKSLKSLDIISHGTPYSLNFSIKENENSGLVTGFIAKMMLKMYYSDFLDGEIYSFNHLSRYVDDIDFEIFTTDARVQMHGCNTANGRFSINTIAEEISIGLWEAGKKLAYVIGHTKKSNPNINGKKTTIIGQDYRHGKRAVIRNGELIYTTTEKGFLEHDYILKKLDNKE